jgi:dethiobiotin synthetase
LVLESAACIELIEFLSNRCGSMKRGRFVTGTGTGVGKTFVTAMLARQAVARGERVFAFKPIETGCTLVSGNRVGEDQELLARAAGDWQQGDLRHLYCFERPLAPLAAARHEGRSIDLFHVERAFVRGAEDADLCLVEGAGGWRVPITELEDMASLARRLDLPVLIVGQATLGTINHCLLTIEAVRGDGCDVEGVVLSRRPEDDLDFARENAAEIRRLAGCLVRLTDDLS